MKTVVESPQARFRREAGLGPIIPSNRRPRVDEWIGLDCGDSVREIGGKHVGRVEAIHMGFMVKVKWDETGWFSWLFLNEVERVHQ
jgi:hypothetical protein